MDRRPCKLSVALALLIAGGTLAAGPQPFPDFWPKGRAPQRAGYDFWRVWLVRCDVRQKPTSPFNLVERHAALTNWVGELVRQKLPVDDVFPRSRAAKLAQMIAKRDTGEAGREVDAVFRGLEALVSGKEYIKGRGRICGKVFDETGAPVAGADVVVFGTPLGAITDEGGAFDIGDVPCTSPRYIVRARKQGFVDAFVGRVNPQPDRPGEAALLLERVIPENGYRLQELAVRVGRLVEIKQVAEPAVPIDTAVADPEKYPAQVKPYLKPSANIDSDHPAVKAQAEQILAAVPEADRTKSTALARAVYEWIVRNVEYDLMPTYPDDPTCGNWQTTFGGWGRSFDDWCYKPSEVLAQRRAICIEFERLAAALLRALNVPARPASLGAHPVCQWWVQLPAGNGYWANMETSLGRNEFKRTGSLNARFPAVGDHAIAFYSVDERAPIHMSWDAKSPSLWLEDYGERAAVGHSEAGLKTAQQWLATFAEKGIVPRGAPTLMPPRMGRDTRMYEVSSRGFVLNLAGLRDQQKLTVRFPMFLSNQYRTTLDVKHWTNHPEWVKEARQEKEMNDITGESLVWYRVDFELGATPPPAPPAPTAPAAPG